MKLAVIPARGGSKRVPKKNIKLFCGKPLISYSIQAALDSGVFDEVIVSTDSPEIADIAKQQSVGVPFMRPEHLSNDHVGTWQVMQHAVREMAELRGTPEYVCCIYATAPFLMPEFLRFGLEALQTDADKQYAFSVTSFSFPILRAISIEENVVAPMFPEHIGKRSQDLPECYHDAGQFYWGRPDSFLQSKPLFSNNSIPIVLPRHLVQDIDTEEDWQRAELMYRAYVESLKDCNQSG